MRSELQSHWIGCLASLLDCVLKIRDVIRLLLLVDGYKAKEIMTSAGQIHSLLEKTEADMNAVPEHLDDDTVLLNMESGEFVDEDRDRRVATVSPRALEGEDGYSGDSLPKQWFKWRKYVNRSVFL